MAGHADIVRCMTISLSFTPVPRTMPLSLVFAEPSTFVVTASGKVTYEETTRVLDEILADPRLDKNIGILVDARAVTGVPTTQELGALAQELCPLHAAGVPAMAIATSSTFVYGIARMFSVLAEHSGLHVQVFRDLAEARRWLTTETA